MKVCIVVGYFDSFSGYQEVALAQALAVKHDVIVISGNIVSPIFTDEHLLRIGHQRTYDPGVTNVNGIKVLRLRSFELRSMVLARKVSRAVIEEAPELVIQIMPGQLLPALATSATKGRFSVVLFGDNRAMWDSLGTMRRLVKWIVFEASKGFLYRYSVRHADKVFGYTPNTISRLRPFVGSKPHAVLPLSFNEETFYLNERARNDFRAKWGIGHDERVIVLAGKYKREKRFEEVIAGFADARNVGAPLKLVVVGSTEAALSGALDGLGDLRRHVIVIPFASQREMNEVFNGGDVGIWPAMPAVTIQQAMGTGLYVVIPDNDLVSHLVKAGTTGKCVEGLEKFAPSEISQLLQKTALCSSLPFDRGGREERVNLNSWLRSDRVAGSLVELASQV